MITIQGIVGNFINYVTEQTIVSTPHETRQSIYGILFLSQLRILYHCCLLIEK